MLSIHKLNYHVADSQKKIERWLEITAEHAPGLCLPVIKAGLSSPCLLPFRCDWDGAEVGGFVLEMIDHGPHFQATFVAMAKTGDIPEGVSLLDQSLNVLEDAWSDAGMTVEVRGLTVQPNVAKILQARGWEPRHVEYVHLAEPVAKKERVA